MKINKQKQICDIDNCYKAISFITEEFVSNKVLWTCEKHKDLLNHTKDKNQKLFYKRLENSKIIFDYETGLLKLWFYKTT
ncbi:MAG: hypothetical protein EIB84_00260 (plasmid) [Spiroplasma poulsonii]|uniref:Uncharacterized protein n=1 Tax=Spiroplasma poulsonii TaxID=2138 RepID=A0A2P6FF10_9MOLU|nr:hypothetical protein [Spiroplasma poulsonii]UXX42213.1 hypothetical protein [Spiroplasma phage MaM-2019a]KAF0850379.1 hypothetical protein MSROBK_019340 [Spiroplasma poulsonii]MBW1241355.1 hypothetical protein [Spiroplasma poulsonii]PQM29981.1 hypothetical protein SMSRO_SF028640 [Spiroplasma poulsonii]PQM30029.1 hypothetical protein SMSRO_SF026860 [Spiroplasma poulsonii]